MSEEWNEDISCRGCQCIIEQRNPEEPVDVCDACRVKELEVELTEAKAKLAKQSAECLMWARSSDKNDEKAFHLEMDIAALKAECDQLKAQVAEAKALDDIATNLAEKLDNWRECARMQHHCLTHRCTTQEVREAIAEFDRLEKGIQ